MLMSDERIKEELKVHTEVFKFLLVVILAIAGGIVTLYNIDKPTHNQEILMSLGWIFAPVLIIGVIAQFLYMYSLLRKIK